MAKPENRLVEQAKAGSADAFGQLYANMHRIFTVLPTTISAPARRRRTQSRMLSAPPSRGLRPAQCLILQGLAFSILSNTCKHHIAAVKERRLTTPLEEARRLGESECSEELMLAMELREAIYALSDEERSIVLLSIIGGYKSMKLPKPSPARPVPFVQNSLVPLRSFA